MPILVDSQTVSGTAVVLGAVWLNAAHDPADSCAFVYAGDAINISSDPRAEVRQLLNRRRIIRTGNKVYDDYGLDLPEVNPDQARWLRAHAGQLLCVRDHVGHKAFGAYTELPAEFDTVFVDRIKVRLALKQVTHTEAV
ncbi:hypothetical protein QWY28_17385 [Nocardioides sp. SOB77]|uniref:Uncharacterized protein n=1 Tax=Nocardioides oceani TaxID=3058369 RepID=A0ABT8FJ83_9ACTN|nr:hypothetical protein [Nocardioides oceani]MDN4174738.1 hypothetical protein [Nocardioides oceani]